MQLREVDLAAGRSQVTKNFPLPPGRSILPAGNLEEKREKASKDGMIDADFGEKRGGGDGVRQDVAELCFTKSMFVPNFSSGGRAYQL